MKSFKELRKLILLSDFIFISVTGNILSLPAYWIAISLSKIYKKSYVIYFHESPISSYSKFSIGTIFYILLPIKLFDIIFFRLFRPQKIFSNSISSKILVIKTYRISKKYIKEIYPLFHL